MGIAFGDGDHRVDDDEVDLADSATNVDERIEVAGRIEAARFAVFLNPADKSHPSTVAAGGHETGQERVVDRVLAAIFYHRPDVFFVSVHRDPSDFYPFYAGYADERGAGPGEGFNLNLPLPAGYDDEACHVALAEGLERVREFGADLLFIALGLDAHRSDPHGSGQMTTAGFAKAAARINRLRLPTVIIQEGGYLSADLGPSLAAFLSEMDS
jgi:hypothetical protein